MQAVSPIWDKLTAEEQESLSKGASLGASLRSVPAGTILHNGSSDCLGLVAVRSGRLRAYIVSDEAGKSLCTDFLKWIYACCPHPA